MSTKTKQTILRELGDGLVMRRTTSADAARLADFNMHIHLSDDTREPDPTIAGWTRDLLRGNHPTVHPDDFVIVEEPSSDRIVSATCLIDQTWTYGGIPFGVGRPELVGTLPEFRRRGLVRQIFQVIHQWSAERGHKMQAITGIPWYYRQFGYEMCLTLDGGKFAYVPQNIPLLKKGAHEPYHIRPATEKDLAFITRTADEAARRDLVSVVRDQAAWRYELTGRSKASVQAMELRIVETPAGAPLGFLTHTPRIFFDGIAVSFYELTPGVSWAGVTPSVLRYLQAAGARYAGRQDKSLRNIFFMLGTEHPVFEAAPQSFAREQPPYAWYVRIPDLCDFVRLITPVLDARLARSAFAGIDGEYKFNFFASGMRLVLETGRVKAVEPWRPESATDGDALFPGLTFLMVLLGHRSANEVKYVFPDAGVSSLPTRALINALFPRQASRPWGIS
ncbi:MAG: GNAT family N-acetyltransferase [Anaerolineae bacterium]